MRLVAFMQYLRVLLVSFGTVLAGQLALPTHEAAGGTALSRMAWFPSPDWSSFWGTVLLVSVAVVLSHRLKIPGGAVLIPFVSGIALNNAGWLHLELPPWLMAGSYALVGWSIGLRFTMPVLKSVVRALPKILLALISLLAVCALFGWAMVTAGGFDPLTAYLATSPGGVDAVAIIAASTGADIPFVMTMQTVRMLLVFFICPGLMRIFSKKFKP